MAEQIIEQYYTIKTAGATRKQQIWEERSRSCQCYVDRNILRISVLPEGPRVRFLTPILRTAHWRDTSIFSFLRGSEIPEVVVHWDVHLQNPQTRGRLWQCRQCWEQLLHYVLARHRNSGLFTQDLWEVRYCQESRYWTWGTQFLQLVGAVILYDGVITILLQLPMLPKADPFSEQTKPNCRVVFGHFITFLRSAWSFTSHPNPLDFCQAVIALSVDLIVLKWYVFLAHTMKYCTKIGETFECCSSGNACSSLIPDSRAKRMNLLRPCWYVTWELSWTALAEWSRRCSVRPSIRGLAGNPASRRRQSPHLKTPPRVLCSGILIQLLLNALVHRVHRSKDRNVASRPHSWHLVVGPAISLKLPQFSCKLAIVTIPSQSYHGQGQSLTLRAAIGPPWQVQLC